MDYNATVPVSALVPMEVDNTPVSDNDRLNSREYEPAKLVRVN